MSFLFFSAAIGIIGAQNISLVAVVEVWPPYRIEAEEGLSGIDIDLLQIIEDELEVQIEIQRRPFARALEMIRSGNADIIPGIAYTEDRDEYIRYSASSYSVVQSVFYAHKDLAPRIRKYEDLYNYRIGYSLNSAYFEPFNSDEELSKLGLSTEAQALKMLELGRVDVIIGTNPNLAYDISRGNLSGELLQTAYVPEPNTPLYLGFPDNGKHPELYRQIDTILHTLIRDGRLESILDSYQ